MPTIYDNPMFQIPQTTTPATTPTTPGTTPATFVPIAPTNDNIFGPGGAFGAGYTGPATTSSPTVTQPTSTSPNTFGAGGAFGVVDPVTGLTRQYNSQGQAYGQLPSGNTFGPGGAFGTPSTGSGTQSTPFENTGGGGQNTTLGSDQITGPNAKRAAVNKALMGQSYFNPSTGMFNW